MQFRAETLVADVATAHPATIRVFQERGIDFCCGGKRPLAEACQVAGVPFDAFASELRAALAEPAPPARDWRYEPLSHLTEYIIGHYHVPLHAELPRLEPMLDKVLSAHSAHHGAQLRALADTFRPLRAELSQHMMKEERILFPFIDALSTARESGAAPPAPPFGTVAHPIRMMEYEHDGAGEALSRMREITAGYAPPEDACNTFRGMLHGLSELERELHEHIHLENNVLHPRAIALEQELLVAG